MSTETTELALFMPDNLPAVFGSPEKVDEVLDRIAKAARAHVPDLTTVTGRKAVASVAHKVARSKTALDDAGKSLTAGLREQIGTVDAERRRIRDFLDGIKDEVRAPLTAWEDAEDIRVADLARRLREIEPEVGPFGETAGSIHAEMIRISAIAIDDSWQERIAEAAQRKDAVLADLRGKLAAAEQREAEQAELARLRAEAAAREEADRAAQAARIDAERRAAAEKAEAERKAAAERAEADRQARLAHEREAAEKRAAEQARIAAERAAAERIAAAERAQREAEERERRAVEAERQRAAEDHRRAEEAEKRKAADAATRARVRREIVGALTGKAPEQIADMIIAGRVPHVRMVL